MRLDVILRVTAKMMIPFIVVFGLYVHIHADYSAGGGFQAGVIIAAALILYAIIFGQRAALRVVPPRVAELMMPLGVLIFAGVGIVSLLKGGAYLDYDLLISGKPVKGQHWGVFLVEIGVIVTVTGTMISIFYAFAGRGRR